MESKDDPKKSAQAPAAATLDLGIVSMEEPENGVFSIYSNVVNLDWTLFDVRIRFSELMHVPNDESPSWQNQHAVVLEHAAIRISWHQAKMLMNQLAGVIHNYEELNGELKLLKLPNAPSED